MPEVVRLRNNHGQTVEFEHPVDATVDHGEIVNVPGRLVENEDDYRRALGLPVDPQASGYVPLSPDIAGYHWVLEPSGQLRGWPKQNWDLVVDAPSATNLKGED
jgi:hypothetical protein